MTTTCPGPHIQVHDFEPGSQLLNLYARQVVEIATVDNPEVRAVWLLGAVARTTDGMLCAAIKRYSDGELEPPVLRPRQLVVWDDLTLLTII